MWFQFSCGRVDHILESGKFFYERDLGVPGQQSQIDRLSGMIRFLEDAASPCMRVLYERGSEFVEIKRTLPVKGRCLLRRDFHDIVPDSADTDFFCDTVSEIFAFVWSALGNL